jgi:hypothetical protein
VRKRLEQTFGHFDHIKISLYSDKIKTSKPSGLFAYGNHVKDQETTNKMSSSSSLQEIGEDSYRYHITSAAASVFNTTSTSPIPGDYSQPNSNINGTNPSISGSTGFSTAAAAASGAPRKRQSALGIMTATRASPGVNMIGGETDSQQPRMRYMSASTSPVTSPTFSNTKTFDTSLASPTGANRSYIFGEPPILVNSRPVPVSGSTTHSSIVGILATRKNAATQRNRLVGFGVIVISMSALLWFSVYQRHSVIDANPVEDTVIPAKGPWLIVSIVLSFLGIAAICAGFAIKKEEEQTRVRVVRGDSVLEMIAEHDRSNASIDSQGEPTTPQRLWAEKAIAEMDRL